MLRLIAVLTLTTTIAGCDAAAPPRGTIDVFKSYRTTQCGPTAGVYDQLERDLTAAGVTVLAGREDSDGMMRIALCGAPDGLIGVFTIPADHLAKAQAAGFQPHDRRNVTFPGG
ncbi:MAG: hypothetical protein Q4G49_16105 [Paracoccus sp. (in: a-proteobacteria)]|nr:hypothetical protein [Paracoccus sp. (in: a-proteobacteria)]